MIIKFLRKNINLIHSSVSKIHLVKNIKKKKSNKKKKKIK